VLLGPERKKEEAEREPETKEGWRESDSTNLSYFPQATLE
jgi:hypothetical protein